MADEPNNPTSESPDAPQRAADVQQRAAEVPTREGGEISPAATETPAVASEPPDDAVRESPAVEDRPLDTTPAEANLVQAGTVDSPAEQTAEVEPPEMINAQSIDTPPAEEETGPSAKPEAGKTKPEADKIEPEAGKTETAEPEAGETETAETETAETETGETEVGETEQPKSEDMQWYILKVQSNREDSIREGLQRRVAIAGLEQYFGDVIVPVEKVTEVKGGRKRVIKRKLYPGYLVVQMEITDDTWFLVRETPGIGDFTGAAGHPTPMLPHEVKRIVTTQEEKADKAPKLQISFLPGDRVKINEGTFENFEGEVDTIDQTSGHVTVMINIFGRSTPVELEYWQIESL